MLCSRFVRCLLVIGFCTIGNALPTPRSAIAQQPAQTGSAQASDAATRQYATAVALQNREQFDLAAQEWQKFLTSFPNDPRMPRAMHYRGLCLLKMRQFGTAVSTFEKLLETVSKLPTGSLVAETADGAKLDLLPPTHLYLGMAQYQVGKAGDDAMLKRADETLAKVLKDYPASRYAPQALYYRGEAAYAAGRKREAAEFYAKLVKDFPEDALIPEALYALGVDQAELDAHRDADATFATFLKKYPQHRLAGEVTMRRGEALLQQGKADEAQKLLASAAALPGFALADHATMRQAASLFEQKKYAEAASVYLSVPQKFPQSPYRPAAWLAAGKCAYLDGKCADAQTSLAKLTPADGDVYLEAVHWIARCRLQEKKPEEVVKFLDPLLPSAAKGHWAAQLRFDRADALHEISERRREAADAYRKVASEYSNDELAPQALYMAAFTCLELEDYKQSQSLCSEFAKTFPKHALTPDIRYIDAESRLLSGDYAEADRKYRELLDDYSKHRDADAWRLRRAQALSMQQKHKDVVALLEPLVGKIEDPELAADASYRLGTSYQALKKYDRAAEALELSLKKSPKRANTDQTLLALAEAYAQADKLDKAQARLQMLIDDYPNTMLRDKVRFVSAQYAAKSGDDKKALAEYRRVIDEAPSSPLVPHALYELGWLQFRAGDASAASKTFDQLIAMKPSDELAAQARYGRAVSREALKQYGGAIDDLQAFIKSKASADDRAAARYRLGLCELAIEKPERAVETFEKLLKDEPKYEGADQVLNELAWTYKSLGKTKDAAERFDRLARKYPDSPLTPEALYHYGQYEYQQEDFKKAATAFRTVTEKKAADTLSESAMHMLGWSLYRQGEFDRARQTFEDQRRKFPKGELASDASCLQGEALFKEGKYREALAVYDKVQKPKAAGLLVLARLHAGQSASQLKDWQRSLKLLQEAAQVDADGEYLPEILYEQAWDQQNLGKPDEALALYQQVTEKTSAEVAARARFMMGEIHFEQKNFERAITDFIAVTDVYGYPQWQAAAMYETARCFEVRGQKEQARKSYQELLQKHPDSDKVPLARERLAALGASSTK